MITDPTATSEPSETVEIGATPPSPPPERSRRSLATVLHELRPSIVTGGATALPLILLFLINAVDELDSAAFGVLLPEIRDWFGVSLGFAITLTSVAGIFQLLFAVPVGYLADRVNRVWMTAISAALWGAMTLGTGFAPTVAWMAIVRFGSGMGKTTRSAQSSLLSDYYPQEVRAGIFSFHQMANSIGQFFGPLLAGFLATWFFWQLPFLLFAIPSLALAVFTVLRLREPVRGEQERRSLGASEEVAMTAEAPPGLAESWRIAKSVRSLRRLWWSFPFLSGSLTVILNMLPLFYDEVFGLNEAARGTLRAFDEPVTFAGLLVGGVVSNRLLRYRPGRMLTYLGVMSVIAALTLAVMALAPILWLAVVFNYGRAFATAILVPGLFAMTTLVIPARVRGFALSIGSVFGAVGLLFAIPLGQIANQLGIRAGLLAMVPIYVIGALLLGSAGAGVDGDIRAATAAAMASHVSRESRQKGRAKMLVVRDLDVHYDSVQVLFNVDFEVDEGELVALLGTNGAGKSTLLRAISGLTPASNGAIFFDDKDITHLPASDHASHGIVQVPGGRGVFPTLTVGENLRLAGWTYRRDAEYLRAATERVLEFFPVLRARLDTPAENLSGGEQQMLTLSQAFLSRPRLLMIDELSLGLAPSVVQQLLEIVKAIHGAGTTVILVEQSVNVALTVAKRAVFMEKGEVRFTGSTAELLGRGDILRAVFLGGGGGGGVGRAARAEARLAMRDAAIALEVRGITKAYGGVAALDGVDLVLREGEILGLIGPNGAGKTTLFDVISGFTDHSDGQVILHGEDITALSADQRAKLGLQRSFQDARLFPSLTVFENIAVALERHLEVRSTVMAALRLPPVVRAEKSVARRVERLIRLLNLEPYREKFVRELSTGTRRIVDLACVMAADPTVLLLDEPSSGIAQREAEELGPLLQRIKWETGCSILIIEHDMPLITTVSDELLALDLGRVVTRGAPHEVLDHPLVVESYLGTSEDVINRSGQVR